MGTFDNTNAILYLNGVEVDHKSVPQFLPANAPLLCIGSYDYLLNNRWIGGLDEMRIYTSALSSNVIAQMYASTDESEIPDTDGDGIPNGWEVQNGLLPFDSGDASGDPDGDDLSNSNEYINATSPWNPDTDGDGMPDGWEVDYGLNPLSGISSNLMAWYRFDETNGTVAANAVTNQYAGT